MDPTIDVTYKNELIRFGSFVGWPGSNANSKSAKPSAIDLAKTGFYYKGEGDEVSCYSCGLTVKDWERHHDPVGVHATRSPHCAMVLGRSSDNYPVAVLDDREKRAIIRVLQQAGKRVLTSVNSSVNNPSSLFANTLTALYGESMMTKRPAPSTRPLNRSLSMSPRLNPPSNPSSLFANTLTALYGESMMRKRPAPSTRPLNRSLSMSPRLNPPSNVRQILRERPTSPAGRGAQVTQIMTSGPYNPNRPQRRSSESESTGPSAGAAAAAAARPSFSRTHSYAPISKPAAANSNTIANKQSSNPNIDNMEFQESERARLKTFEGWKGIKGASAQEFAQAGFIFHGAPDLVQCVFCRGILRNWNDNDKPIDEHRKHFPQCSFVKDYLSAITTAQPRHSEYKTLDSREKSFEKWTKSNSNTASASPSPSELARAGFYYVGHGDSVKCFFCDGGLRNWEPNDDPWREHARWFPKCDYVRQSKGRPYIEAVLHETRQEEYQTASVDQTELKNVDGANAGAAAQKREVDPREVTSRMDSAIVKTVLKMEVPKELVRKAIRKRLADESNDFSSAEALLEAIFNLGQEEEGEDLESSGSTHESSIQEIGGPSSNSSTDQDSIRLMEENRQLKEQKQCKICMDEEVCVAFLPCGHLVCCSTCAPALSTCPICRAKIRGTVRTYMA